MKWLNDGLFYQNLQVYTVCGIYIGFAALAFLLICFLLDPITLDKEEDAESRKFSFKLTLETFKHWLYSDYQKLLVIITMYSGVEQAFMTGDFTKVSNNFNPWVQTKQLYP